MERRTVILVPTRGNKEQDGCKIPSEVTLKRIDAAEQLLKQHPTAIVLFSGGKLSGERDSDARVAYNFFRKVSPKYSENSFVVEPNGNDNFVNMRAVADWIREETSTDDLFPAVVVCSHPSHGDMCCELLSQELSTTKKIFRTQGSSEPEPYSRLERSILWFGIRNRGPLGALARWTVSTVAVALRRNGK